MASVARTNPTAVAIGVLQSTLQLALFKCVLSNAFIGDAHALDVDIVAIRLGRIIGTGSRTSSGVWTFTDTSTLTVTSPTTFVGLQT